MAAKKKAVKKVVKKAVKFKAKTQKKKAAKKNNVAVFGRPTKYLKEYAEQARKLCLLGYTDVELADFFGVADSTLDNWKNKHPDFLGSLKKGKAVADANVAESLYFRALGYEHDDIHITNYQGKITKTKITKKYPPDTSAAILWLKNRQSTLWRDAKDINVGGQPDSPLLILARSIQGETVVTDKE